MSPNPIERAVAQWAGKRRVRTALIAVGLCLALVAGVGRPSRAAPVAPRPAPAAGGGLVSVSHPLAAEAGAEMLRRGGNAVDAAVATQFALNVVEPQMSGIGGGGFLVVYLAWTGATLVLDGRETAPAAATPDQFLGAGGRPLPFETAHQRGTAVGVPGTLRLLQAALDWAGTMSLAETMGPAIDLAEGGFAVNRFLAQDVAANQGKLAAWPPAAAVFLPGGRPIPAGTWLRQPELAQTLRLIQHGGPDILYQGEVGAAIVATQAARDGRMTLDDLAAYRVRERAPLTGSYREYQVATVPPPSSGGVALLQILGLVEPFELGLTGPGTAPTRHLVIEAMRLAYADRAAYLGDPEFAAVPVRGLIDPGYLAERRAGINPERANPRPAPGNPWAYQPEAAAPGPIGAAGPEGDHTTHFVTVDREDNVVSFTSTIESVWGSGLLVPGYGFFLNNELTDFDFVPGGPNQVEPGKRPRSSMTPTIVFRDGRPVLALGSPGGPTIISTVAGVTLNVLEHGLGIQEAIDAPRIYAPDYPGVAWEAGIDRGALAGLAANGHRPDAGPSVLGSVQAALRGPDGGWIGGADGRREGTVIRVPGSIGSDW